MTALMVTVRLRTPHGDEIADALRQREPVGRDAQDRLGVRSADEVERLERRLVGERLAGTRDADGRDLSPLRSTTARTRSIASSGVRIVLATPGRDSLTQSYLRTQ